MFLCHVLYPSLRPDVYLQGVQEPVESMHAKPEQVTGIVQGANPFVMSLQLHIFCVCAAKAAQSMVFPEHIWDPGCYISPCCSNFALYQRADSYFPRCMVPVSPLG